MLADKGAAAVDPGRRRVAAQRGDCWRSVHRSSTPATIAALRVARAMARWNSCSNRSISSGTLSPAMSVAKRSSSASCSSVTMAAANAQASPSNSRRASVSSRALTSLSGRVFRVLRRGADIDTGSLPRLDQTLELQGDHRIADGRAG